MADHIRFAAALLALATQGCVHAPVIRAQVRPGWVRVESDHFSLRTDLEPSAARAAIEDLELARWAMLQPPAPPAAASLAPRKIALVLLFDDEELAEVAAGGARLIESSDALGEPILAASGQRTVFESPWLLHALHHRFVEPSLGEAPTWLREGLAARAEGLRRPSGAEFALAGGPNPQRARLIRSARGEHARLLDRTAAELASLPDSEREEFIAWSWLLLQVLEQESKVGLEALVRGCSNGLAWEQAWEAGFPGAPKDKFVERAVKGSRLAKSEGHRQAWPGGTSIAAIEPLPGPALHALRALLLAAGAQDAAGPPGAAASQGATRPPGAALATRARAEAAISLSLDPANADALFASLTTGTDVLEKVRAAALMAPQSPATWALLARAESAGANPEAALAALDAAATLAPRSARLLARLALLESPRSADRAGAAARRAVALERSPASLEALGVALAAEGRCAPAQAALRESALSSGDQGAAREARRLWSLAAAQASHCEERPAQVAPAPTALPLWALDGAAPAPDPACLESRPQVAPGTHAVVLIDYIVQPDGSTTAVRPRNLAPAALADAVQTWLARCHFSGAGTAVSLTHAFIAGGRQ